MIVDEIGLERLMDEVRLRLVCPLAEALFTAREHGGAASLDHHHAFSVSYAPAADRYLDMHHDDSEVTLNVCLGKQFEGAGLTFCGRYGDKDYRRHSVTSARPLAVPRRARPRRAGLAVGWLMAHAPGAAPRPPPAPPARRPLRLRYAHKPGRAVLHLGTQRHGADTISSGERTSLILWARSSSYRSSAIAELPAHQREPVDLVCLSHTHDIDYEKWRPLPDGVVGKRERLARLRAMGGG